MKGNVMGVSLVSFPDRETGALVQGTSIYVAAESLDSFGKIPYKVWVEAGTPLESKLANYLKTPGSLVGKDVEFAYKPKSTRVAQFDIL